jgi:hypothetical protein
MTLKEDVEKRFGPEGGGGSKFTLYKFVKKSLTKKK